MEHLHRDVQEPANLIDYVLAAAVVGVAVISALSSLLMRHFGI